MMEDSGDTGSESELNDESSAPPDFAMPPGGVQDANPSSDDGSSVTPADADATPPVTTPEAAPSDPFDLMSMTSTATTAQPAQNNVPIGDFDLFSSTTSAMETTSAPVSTQDLFGGFESPAIDISSQESMMSASQPCNTTDNETATVNPELLTAESGDLLGLTGPSPPAAPANDFMDADFQSMPVPAPAAATNVDPFANSDLFSAQPVTNNDTTGVEDPFSQQFQQEEAKQEEEKLEKEKEEPVLEEPKPVDTPPTAEVHEDAENANESSPPDYAVAETVDAVNKTSAETQGVAELQTDLIPEATPNADPVRKEEVNEPQTEFTPESIVQAKAQEPALVDEALSAPPNAEPVPEEAATETETESSPEPIVQGESPEEPALVDEAISATTSEGPVSKKEATEVETESTPELIVQDERPEEPALVVNTEEVTAKEEAVPEEPPLPSHNGAVGPHPEDTVPQGKNNSNIETEKAVTESIPETQPESNDLVLEEDSAVFEEVELASPQRSEEEQKAKAIENDAVKKGALAKDSLKPPIMDQAPLLQPTDNSQPTNEVQAKRIRELESMLATAQKDVKDLQKQKLQHEMQAQDSQAETTSILQELETKLQQETSQRGEAENDVNLAKEEIKKLEASLKEKGEQWNTQTAEWGQQLGGLEKENEALIVKARQELEDRKEHERRERVLANKLNNLKKKQATTTDVDEVHEDDIRMLKDDVASNTKKVEELENAKASLEKQLEKEKEMSGTRIEQLEKAVREEKHLNDERKKKMKSFIEAKAEELKEAKAESEHYQTELNQGNSGMVDLNNRWKTLHAQWVQSQTRNRELQRDLNKIKKDSENLHKVGDSLNVKLSSSAKETEQHKNKRLAAKQELMSVLGQLESEREITNRLRDSVRFTFTAKAQSQHQLLQENLTEFHQQLESLAMRLGKPIPLRDDRNSQTLPSLVMSAVDESEASEHDDLSSPTSGANTGASKEQKRILLETTRLLAKLENETQHISQGIMALTSAIEQMTRLLKVGGDNTCFGSLGSIFLGGGLQKAIEADQNKKRAAPTRYDHSSLLPTEGRTYT